MDRSKRRKIAPTVITTTRTLPDNSRINLDVPSFTLPTEGNRFWNEDDTGNTPGNNITSSIDIQKLDKNEFELYKKRSKRRFWVIIGWLVSLTIWILVLTIVYVLHLPRYSSSNQYQYPQSQVIQLCTSNANCTGEAQYCDTQFSHQCSVCLISDHCEDPSLQYCDSFGTRSCHECLYNRHCTTSPNLVCDTDDTRKCVECMENKDCANNPVNKICDLTTNTCSMPCTTAMCASRTDGKTKCCGTRCIEDCPGGFACDVLKSQCILKKPSGPKGTNVARNATSLLTGCSHCHYTNLKITGSMFNRTQLQTMEYMTGFEYIFKLSGTSPQPNITNATLYYQDALNCSKNDFNTSPFIELGVYPLINESYVDFENILPVTSECFFILTSGTFQTNFFCDASYDYIYQVAIQTNNVTVSINHTPFYELYGY